MKRENIQKPRDRFEVHLTIREFSIPQGEEWTPRAAGWSVIQVRRGTGYYLLPQQNRELEPGAVLLTAGHSQGSLRASQLGELVLNSFSVLPTRLAGLITLSEQNFLEQAAGKKDSALKFFPPDSPQAARMNELCVSSERGGLLFRLDLFRLFIELFGRELEAPAATAGVSDAKRRLQVFLEEIPSSELLEMNFNELAQMTRCTSRHLSRIFHELVGMSFRERRADLRLSKARELLANSNSKVVDVALESGYKSLSLFNLMFARRFGTSPGKWRQKFTNCPKEPGYKKPKRLLEMGVGRFQTEPPARLSI
jgi:AraC-like DNA-binding protein